MQENNEFDYIKLLDYDFNLESKIPEYEEMNWLERYVAYRTMWNYDKLKNYDLPRLHQYVTIMHDSGKFSNLCDPDGSGYKSYPFSHYIYFQLWKWRNEKNNPYGLVDNNYFRCVFGGDTMNSLQTVLGRVIELVAKDNDWKEINPSSNIKTYSDAFTINLYLERADEMKSTLEKIKGLKEYVQYYTTLGNFCLVPYGFNGSRGMNRKLSDYWDRSLSYLKENGWKDTFSMSEYNRYINYFFLWDWVDCDGNVANLSSNLTSIEEYSEFMIKTIDKIKRRSAFMIAMLGMTNYVGFAYNEIQNEIFADNSKIHTSYIDVINKIMQSPVLAREDAVISMLSKLKAMYIREQNANNDNP